MPFENIKMPVEIKKPVEEVRYIEEIQLPMLSEITDENGKVKLPPELIAKLRDPRVKKRIDLVVFPFFDEANNALIVARSQEIVGQLRRNYPTVVKLLDHNRKGTLAFLKANNALIIHEVVHEFSVSSGSDSWDGKEVGRQYKEEINNYVDKLCKNLIDRDGKIVDRELFKPARVALAEYIHKEYRRKLPDGPFPFCENNENIKLEISGSYRSTTNYYVVGSCSGRIDVRDENRGICDFHARFRGSPEVKVLVLDFDKLGEIERDFREDIEAAKALIDRKEIEYRRERPNLLEYGEKKYI